MVKIRKYTSLFLAIVYAFFFASTNLFYHSHQLETSRLVHSHPFTGHGHTHTTGQILLIYAVDSEIFQESSDIVIPDFLPDFLCRETDRITVQKGSTSYDSSFFLRAPPAKA